MDPTSSDGLLLNVTSVLLKLCDAFLDPHAPDLVARYGDAKSTRKLKLGRDASLQGAILVVTESARAHTYYSVFSIQVRRYSYSYSSLF